jgi:hypothetical protein
MRRVRRVGALREELEAALDLIGETARVDHTIADRVRAALPRPPSAGERAVLQALRRLRGRAHLTPRDVERAYAPCGRGLHSRRTPACVIVRRLRQKGYPILRSPGLGYRLPRG